MVWEAILRWCKTAALINGLKLHTGERDGSFKLLHIPPTELIANHTLLSACVCACACVCVCVSVCLSVVQHCPLVQWHCTKPS